MSDARGTNSSLHDVSYGLDVSTDGQLRLCGDVRGKRTIELGLFGLVPNCIALAQHGARSIAVDPSAKLISNARRATERAGVAVEFHNGDIADLGFAMSSSLDLALCVHALGRDDDYSRLFRQVHRVLKPEAGFVFCSEHPAAAIFEGEDLTARRQYGSTSPAIGELVMALQRANFAIDTMYELSSVRRPRAIAPTALLLRARKLGS
ncbi:MAG: class I SAM-dependent methyltransferase [Ilumatobacteraceae bacterium]|nr:class I SAM-dependent methyltransferase [Ilumatobacteraceae bacterium]